MVPKALRPGVWIVGPLAAFLLAYLPDVGRGFIGDDFRWIADARVAREAGWWPLLTQDNGFYRPLVALTFAITDAAVGLQPFWYGLTNLALALGCGCAIAILARSLGMSSVIAAGTGALWLLNPHGINMAVLWMSGRTALLLTLFAVLAAIAVTRGGGVAAALFVLAALLSKEEAVLLPAILALWWWIPRRGVVDARIALRTTTVLLAPLAVYAILRSATHAMLPGTAPWFYRPTFDPWPLLRNVAEYADRALTFPCLAAVVVCVLAWRLPNPAVGDRQVMAKGAIWIFLASALTVFLPIRSSLYTCFPSVGAVLVVGAAIDSACREASRSARMRVAIATAIVPLLLIPIYRDRNLRWVRPAQLSSAVLAEVPSYRKAMRRGATLVLHDAVGARVNLATSFGTLLPDAVRLATGLQTARVWIEPPPPAWQEAGLVPPEHPTLHLWLRDGRLVSRESFPFQNGTGHAVVTEQ